MDDNANIRCLRHAFASCTMMVGQSLAQTGALLRNKSSQTTFRYADNLTEAIHVRSQSTENLPAAE
jgi:site-specific recombinase XerD